MSGSKRGLSRLRGYSPAKSEVLQDERDFIQLEPPAKTRFYPRASNRLPMGARVKIPCWRTDGRSTSALLEELSSAYPLRLIVVSNQADRVWDRVSEPVRIEPCGRIFGNRFSLHTPAATRYLLPCKNLIQATGMRPVRGPLQYRRCSAGKQDGQSGRLKDDAQGSLKGCSDRSVALQGHPRAFSEQRF